MKFTILYVGKTASKEISELTTSYLGRIKFRAIDVKIITNLKKNYTKDMQRQLEGEKILCNIKADDYVVLLDDKGKEFTSLEFAAWIENRQMAGKNVVFIIGGAFGFSKEVYARQNFILSLSRMTFSHQIIRAIFAEQLYRAFSIINNEPYHH